MAIDFEPDDEGGIATVAHTFADPGDLANFALHQRLQTGDNGIGHPDLGGLITARADVPMVALPERTLIDRFGSIAAARGRHVWVQHGANGSPPVRALIADVGPGRGSVRRGVGIDLNPGAAAAIGATGADPVSYHFDDTPGAGGITFEPDPPTVGIGDASPQGIAFEPDAEPAPAAPVPVLDAIGHPNTLVSVPDARFANGEPLNPQSELGAVAAAPTTPLTSGSRFDDFDARFTNQVLTTPGRIGSAANLAAASLIDAETPLILSPAQKEQVKLRLGAALADIVEEEAHYDDTAGGHPASLKAQQLQAALEAVDKVRENPLAPDEARNIAQRRQVAEDTRAAADIPEKLLRSYLTDWGMLKPTDSRLDNTTASGIAEDLGSAPEIFVPGAGLPMFVMEAKANAYKGAFDAAKAEGRTDAEAGRQADKESNVAAAKVAATLPAYAAGGALAGAAGKVAAETIPALEKPLARGLAEGALATGANAAISSGARGVEGEQPFSARGFASDAAFGLLHGKGAAAAADLRLRGVADLREQMRQERAAQEPASSPSTQEKPASYFLRQERASAAPAPPASASVEETEGNSGSVDSASNQPNKKTSSDLQQGEPPPREPVEPTFAAGETAEERADAFLQPEEGDHYAPTAVRFEPGEAMPDELFNSPSVRTADGATVFYDPAIHAPEDFGPAMPGEFTPPSEPAPTERLQRDRDLEAKHRAEQEREARESISGAGGTELIDAVRRAGGLPTDDPVFRGELRNVREASQSAPVAGHRGTFNLFRKDAPRLDELTNQLRAQGFDVQTPSDTLDLIHRRLTAQKPVYGFPAREEAQMGMAGSEAYYRRTPAAPPRTPAELRPLQRRWYRALRTLAPGTALRLEVIKQHALDAMWGPGGPKLAADGSSPHAAILDGVVYLSAKALRENPDYINHVNLHHEVAHHFELALPESERAALRRQWREEMLRGDSPLHAQEANDPGSVDARAFDTSSPENFSEWFAERVAWENEAHFADAVRSRTADSAVGRAAARIRELVTRVWRTLKPGMSPSEISAKYREFLRGGARVEAGGDRGAQFARRDEHDDIEPAVWSKGSVRVSSTSGDRFWPADPRVQNPGKVARQTAMRFATDPANGIVGTHRNADTGWKIEVSKSKLQHASQHSTSSGPRDDYRAHLEALPAVPELIRNAIKTGTKADKTDNPDYAAIHTFHAPLRIGDRSYRARMTVQEVRQGGNRRLFYDHSLFRLEDPGNGDSRLTRPDGTPANLGALRSEHRAGAVMSVADLFRDVKPPEGPKFTRRRQTPAPTRDEPTLDESAIHRAYRALVAQDGWSDVRISDLSARSGVPPERLGPWIKEQARAGKAIPSRGDWSLSRPKDKAAAIEVRGEPHLQVRFRDDAPQFARRSRLDERTRLEMYAGRKATGFDEAERGGRTFEGPYDQKPRFEINDKRAKLNPGWAGLVRGVGAGDFPLRDVLGHAELYRQYPDLANLPVSVRPTLPDRQLGAYHRPDAHGKGERIDMLASDDPVELRRTLLHEVQHAVQYREGFARGGAPEPLGYDHYKRLAGEIEARDVERRSDYPAAERRTIQPFEAARTEYPPEKAIMRFASRRSRDTGTGDLFDERKRKEDKFALESATPEQLRAEDERRRKKDAIAEALGKPLKGTPGDLTADMFGAGDTPLFNERRDQPKFVRRPGNQGDYEAHTNVTAMVADADHARAKSGDREAAERLVARFLKAAVFDRLAGRLDRARPVRIVFPHAEESTGRNGIPRQMAAVYEAALSRRGFDATADHAIVQTTRASHTTAAHTGERIASAAHFDGKIERGAQYVVVDDAAGSGGTLANLAGHIHEGGGDVRDLHVLATGRGRKTLAARPEDITLLQETYGKRLDSLLRQVGDHGLDQVTLKEGLWLASRAREGLSFDGLRDRILARRREGGAGMVPGTSAPQSAPRSVNEPQAATRRTIQGARGLIQSREKKQEIAAGKDAGVTRAGMIARQAANSVRLDFPDLKDREAMPFVIEAAGIKAALQHDLMRVQNGSDPKLVRQYAPIIQHGIDNFDRLNALKGNYETVAERQRLIERRHGIETPHVKNYVTRLLELPEHVSQLEPILLGGGSGSGGSRYFVKGRDFATLAEAVEAGYAPKSTDIADLLERRVRTGQELVQQRRLWSRLRAATAPGDPAGRSIIGEREPHVTLSGRTELRVPLGYETVNAGGDDLIVHKQYAGLFKALYGQSALRQSTPGRLLVKYAAAHKSISLAIDTYHAVRMTAKAAFYGHTFGYDRGLSLLEYSDRDLSRAVSSGDVTQREADYARRMRPMADELIKAGLNVGRFSDNIAADINFHVPGTAALNKWIFEKLSRGAMLQSAINGYEYNLKRFGELGREGVARRTAKEVNEVFGNLGSQGLFKNKTFQDISRLIFLAPQWTESQARAELRGLGQVARIPVDAARGRLRVGFVARGMATSFVALLAMNQIVNFASRGQFTWDNKEEGHKLDAFIPGGKRGFWFNPFEIAAEFTHMAMRYWAKGERGADIASHLASNKLTGVTRGAMEAFSGRDYGGRPFLSDADRYRAAATDLIPMPFAATAGLEKDPRQPLGYRLSRQSGSMEKQALQSFGVKVTPEESPETKAFAMAQPFRPDRRRDGAMGEYTELRRALGNDNTEAAKDEIRWLVKKREKKLETIREALGLKKDGSVTPEKFAGGKKADEQDMVRHLTPAQREIYRAAQLEHELKARRAQRLMAELRGEL